MERVLLNNFFIPEISKQFRLKPLSELNLNISEASNFKKSQESGAQIPIGLSDGCKINKEYKELTKLLKIDTFSWEDAMKFIQMLINSNKANEISDEILEELEAMNKYPVMRVDKQVEDLEVKLITLWRTTRLSYADLALKTHKTPIFVEKWIKEFKKWVKDQKKIRKRDSSNKRRVIDERQIDQINDYWWRNRSHQLTLRKIKDEIWKNKNISDIPSNSTIGNVLKRSPEWVIEDLQPDIQNQFN